MRNETSLLRLLPALLSDLPALLDEVSGALRELDPSYTEFLASGREEIVASAELAMRNLVEGAAESLAGRDTDAQGGSGPADDVSWTLFEEVGRDLWRQQLPVRTILSAYQIGGRVGWRRMSALAVRHGLPADAMAALAEAVFRLVDHLGTATTSGYVEEQAQSAIAREQLRDALVERLLSGRSGGASVEQAARSAGWWPLPSSAAVVLLRPDDEPGRQLLSRLPPDFLPLRHTPLPGAIIPDPAAPGRRQRLVAALRGTTAVVGPTVGLADLPESARLTEAAAQTLEHRVPEDAPVFVVDHLDEFIVHRDRRLLDALRAHCLRPLEGAAPASRQALCETLRSWLVHMGNRRAVAEELRIHPQTVRYRLARLHELFGPALDDPHARLRLLLTLGWEDRPTPPVSRPVSGTATRRDRSAPPPGPPPQRSVTIRGRSG